MVVMVGKRSETVDWQNVDKMQMLCHVLLSYGQKHIGKRNSRAPPRHESRIVSLRITALWLKAWNAMFLARMNRFVSRITMILRDDGSRIGRRAVSATW